LAGQSPDRASQGPTSPAEVAEPQVPEANFAQDAAVEAAAPKTALGEAEAGLAAAAPGAPATASSPASNSTPAQKVTLTASGPNATGAKPEPIAPAEPAAPKKPLFWSAALAGDTERASEPPEPDQSRVPPVLRALRKCEACGFPVSTGRVLCVECEEKKWRGQLRTPPRAAAKAAAVVAPSTVPARAAAQASTAAAPTMAKDKDKDPVALAAVSSAAPAINPAVPVPAAKGETSLREPPRSDAAPKAVEPEVPRESQAATATREAPVPELVLSAAMDPPQPWLASHKYVVLVLVLAAGIAAAFYFLR
jgi:ribonuclease E